MVDSNESDLFPMCEWRAIAATRSVKGLAFGHRKDN